MLVSKDIVSDLAVHRVIILNRGSMFVFHWREFSPPLCSAHRLLQCYYSQKRDRTRCNSRLIPPSATHPTATHPLANESVVPYDVTLWRCTLRSGKFVSVFPILLWRRALSSSIMTLCGSGHKKQRDFL